jgi:hypothetical protein
MFLVYRPQSSRTFLYRQDRSPQKTRQELYWILKTVYFCFNKRPGPIQAQVSQRDTVITESFCLETGMPKFSSPLIQGHLKLTGRMSRVTIASPPPPTPPMQISPPPTPSANLAHNPLGSAVPCSKAPAVTSSTASCQRLTPPVKLGNMLLSSCPGKKGKVHATISFVILTLHTVRLGGPVKGRSAVRRDLGTDLKRIWQGGVRCIIW